MKKSMSENLVLDISKDKTGILEKVSYTLAYFFKSGRPFRKKIAESLLLF
jgi:hypothetical protein